MTVWPRCALKTWDCYSLNPENGNPRRSAFPACFSITICDKIVCCPVPSLRNMCVKGDSIEFFLALQSIVNCSFLSYDRSCCVSASQKNKTGTGVQSTLHRFETDRKTKRPTGKKKEDVWACLSKRDKQGYSRRIGSQMASLMIIELHISAKDKQKSSLCLCPQTVCPQEETDGSWLLLFYCRWVTAKSSKSEFPLRCPGLLGNVSSRVL